MRNAHSSPIFAAARKPDPRRLRERMVRGIQARGINDPLVIQAMLSVPRHLFVPEACASHAYDDASLPIGYGQTISQPFTVAKMTSLLELEPGMRVLEIGTGSGYQAAVISTMGCAVYGIERLSELYKNTLTRLRKLGFGNIHIQRGDGTLGFPLAAPFDRIIVTAGGPEIPPPLLEQLGENGIMVIPVGERPGNQRLLRLRKARSKISSEDLGAAVFVDLIGNHGW